MSSSHPEISSDSNIDDFQSSSFHQSQNQFEDAFDANDSDPYVGCNLIVNYLPHSIDENFLMNIFAPYGEIIMAKVVRDKNSKKGLGYGFVKYRTEEEAHEAIKNLNGYCIESINNIPVKKKFIKVSLARPPSLDIRNCKLYVTHLPKNYNETEVFNLFSKYGEIVECRVLIDTATGLSRGVAFILYARKSQAQAALALNGHILEGRNCGLVVKYAEDQHRKKELLAQQFRQNISNTANNMNNNFMNFPSHLQLPHPHAIPSHHLPPSPLPHHPLPHHSRGLIPMDQGMPPYYYSPPMFNDGLHPINSMIPPPFDPTRPNNNQPINNIGGNNLKRNSGNNSTNGNSSGSPTNLSPSMDFHSAPPGHWFPQMTPFGQAPVPLDPSVFVPPPPFNMHIPIINSPNMNQNGQFNRPTNIPSPTNSTSNTVSTSPTNPPLNLLPNNSVPNGNPTQPNLLNEHVTVNINGLPPNADANLIHSILGSFNPLNISVFPGGKGRVSLLQPQADFVVRNLSGQNVGGLSLEFSINK